MAGSNYLLDTVMVAAYFNREEAIRERMKDNTFFVSSITIGELYYGAYNSQQIINNVQQIRNFIEIATILGCNTITADFYGQIKHQLKVKGRPIPENDIWIAAVAMQHGLSLVSRDAHFNEVDNLRLEVW
jgi:tRNA(fMet)-specific endonuclease VapC